MQKAQVISPRHAVLAEPRGTLVEPYLRAAPDHPEPI